MKYIRHIPSKNIFPQGCVVTIGNFDGVHRGHQTIIAGLRSRAREMGLPLVIITFDPHPEEFFLGDKAPPRLTNCRDRLTVMRELGVDCAICLSFNARLAETTAEAFIQDYLIDGLGAKYLLVGDDFHFGKGRQGNIEMLRDWSGRGGYQVGCMATFVDENQRISSTRIRSRLQHGDLEEAERLLGRPYTISGRVVHGDKRGRSWGFPTANLLLNREPPLSGVFAVDVSGLGESKRAGVANLGRRPTVGGNRLLLETHLLDFDREIYGERICVEFLHKIRDERKFESFEELKSQIAQDLAEAREIFTAHEKISRVESPAERALRREPSGESMTKPMLTDSSPGGKSEQNAALKVGHRAFWNCLLLALAIVIADQAAKALAIHSLADRPPIDLLPILSLVLVFNSGAAFGFLNQAGGWQTLLFSIVALLVSALLVHQLRKIASTQRQAALAFALILGGAVGNLIDRLGTGVVTDYILFHYGDWQFPAFNIADIAITVGAALLIMDAIGWRVFKDKTV